MKHVSVHDPSSFSGADSQGLPQTLVRSRMLVVFGESAQNSVNFVESICALETMDFVNGPSDSARAKCRYLRRLLITQVRSIDGTVSILHPSHGLRAI